MFAVSSYAFWWAGILLFLAVLWDPARGLYWLRWLFIIFGGLSSPIIGATIAGLAVRAITERRRSEYLALALATVVFAVQILAMRGQGLLLYTNTLGLLTLKLIVEQYTGGFIYAEASALFGLAVLGALAAIGWRVRMLLDRYFFLLVLTFLLVAMSVSLRMPIESFAVINQFNVAPRYFFYPFILLSWIGVWLASLSTTPVKIGLVAAFGVSLLSAGSALSRRHDAVDWKTHILACANSQDYQLPVHYIGHTDDMWYVQLSGRECKKLLKRSIF